MTDSIESRREFLRRSLVTAFAVPFLAACRSETLAQSDSAVLRRIKQNALPPGGEWSGAVDVPANVSSVAVLALDKDAGEPMIISGTVYQPNGKGPAPNTLIYIYHTNAKGIYGSAGQHKHGIYRGWMLTDSRGRYEFRSIRPASYPNMTFAAHVHMTVTGEDRKEDWIDSILFEGDKFISAREREMAGKKGGFNPIVRLEQGTDGILRATRDIQLN